MSYTISLEDFTPHHEHIPPLPSKHDDDIDPVSASAMGTPARAIDEQESDEILEPEPLYYTHPCRCSSQFTITRADLEEGVEVVGCEGCGEWVRVGYEVVSEDGDADGDDTNEKNADGDLWDPVYAQ